MEVSEDAVQSKEGQERAEVAETKSLSKGQGAQGTGALRELDITFTDDTKFQDVDGGLLVRDAILLAEGQWTDSKVKTPLFYPAKTLQKYADNWKDSTIWSRHTGNQIRSIVDKIGSVKNKHYNPQYRAIMGDLFFHCRTQASKDASELVRCGEINAVSVEHDGEERFNSSTGRMEAESLVFYGLAPVTVGACEVCKIRHNSGNEQSTDSQAPQVAQDEQTPPIRENGTMDDETKKAMAELVASLKALQDAWAEKEKRELELKKVAEANPVVPLKAEDITKALAPFEERLKVLEEKPEPRSLQPKEDKKELDKPEIKVRSRTMSQDDFN